MCFGAQVPGLAGAVERAVHGDEPAQIADHRRRLAVRQVSVWRLPAAIGRAPDDAAWGAERARTRGLSRRGRGVSPLARLSMISTGGQQP